MNINKGTEALLKQMKVVDDSEATIRSYKNQLKTLERFMNEKYNLPIDLADITLNDMEEFFYHLRKERNWKINSVNIAISAANKLFAFAERNKWITENIMVHIQSLKKEQKEPDFLNEQEMGQVIDAIDHDTIRLVVRTLANTGLRISECLGLTLDDVDLVKNKIYVLNGKGRKCREVPIADSLSHQLAQYKLQDRPKVSTNYFFVLEKTEKLSSQYVNRKLKEVVEKVGIKKAVSCHTFRHGFASTLIRKGVDLPTVAKLLGHSDYRTVTSIYVHIEEDQLDSAVNLMAI